MGREREGAAAAAAALPRAPQPQEGGASAALPRTPAPPSARPHGHPQAPGKGRGWQQVLRRSRKRSLHHRHAGACERRRVHARRRRSRTAPSLPPARPPATAQRPVARGREVPPLHTRSRGCGEEGRPALVPPQKAESAVAAATRRPAPSRVRRRRQGPGARRGSADRRCHPHLCAALRQGEPRGAGGGRGGDRLCRLAPGLSLPSPAPRPPLVSDAPGSRNSPPPPAPWNRTQLRPAHRRGNPAHRPGAVPAGSQWAPRRGAPLIGWAACRALRPRL